MGLYFLSSCQMSVVLQFANAYLATVRSSEILTTALQEGSNHKASTTLSERSEYRKLELVTMFWYYCMYNNVSEPTRDYIPQRSACMLRNLLPEACLPSCNLEVGIGNLNYVV